MDMHDMQKLRAVRTESTGFIDPRENIISRAGEKVAPVRAPNYGPLGP